MHYEEVLRSPVYGLLSYTQVHRFYIDPTSHTIQDYTPNSKFFTICQSAINQNCICLPFENIYVVFDKTHSDGHSGKNFLLTFSISFTEVPIYHFGFPSLSMTALNGKQTNTSQSNLIMFLIHHQYMKLLLILTVES